MTYYKLRKLLTSEDQEQVHQINHVGQASLGTEHISRCYGVEVGISNTHRLHYHMVGWQRTPCPPCPGRNR